MKPHDYSLSEPGSRPAAPAWCRALLVTLAAAALAVLAVTARPPEPTRASSTYTLLKTYPNPSPTPNDEFGNAVAWMPSGDKIAVAARSDQLTGTVPVGAVYILAKDSGAVLRVLSRGGGAVNDYLGYSLAVSGTRVLAGAPHDNAGALIKAGAAYLFDSVSGGVVMTFTDPIGHNSGYFGSSVAILSDSAVLIGEPNYPAPATPDPIQNVGRAYICQVANGHCNTPIDVSDPASHDGANFGYSVVSLGDKFAVGAPLDGFYGTVYIYTTSTAALVKTIIPVSTTLGGSFGWSLAAVNGNLLIGAQDDSLHSIPNAGAAFLYRPDGTPLRVFRSPSPESNARFGASVASDGTFIVIGAPGAAGGEGRVYLYSAASGALIDTFQGPTPHAGDNFGNSVAVMGENFLAGAPGDNPSAVGGAAYRFGVAPPLPANFARSSKSVNSTLAQPGNLITYTLTLSNTGTIAATFVLTDALDSHLSLVSAPGLSGTGTLTATGTLSGTTQLSFNITVRTSQAFIGTVPNVAQLSGDGAVRNLAAPLVRVGNWLWLPLAGR